MSLLLTHWFPVLFHATPILEFSVASNKHKEPVMWHDVARRGMKGAQGTSV